VRTLTGTASPSFVRRTTHVLRPDPARVVNNLFLPGQEIVTSGLSRSTAVLHRVLALSDAEVTRTLSATLSSFEHRHRNLEATFESRFAQIEHRLDHADELPAERRQLIGAYFSQEFAVEAAALFNPSMVAHPDQQGVAKGALRFVMSVRAVGEGHLSSVEFRTGTVDGRNVVHFDSPGPVMVLPQAVATTYDRNVFEHQHAELGGDQGSADFVLRLLPPRFGRSELDAALGSLLDQRLTRGSGDRTVERFERIAACNYAIEFPVDSAIFERVIVPGSPSESHGIEDVRLVRYTEDDGSVDYRGTYTAFDGVHVVPQLLRTKDFRTFCVSQLSGPAAKNKGMAMFPRPVGGTNLALSRWDRESNSLTSSQDGLHWENATPLQTPEQGWELIQLGNCGSPLETTEGWLVLTHGVGPMREYCIGALLLDLDDPRKVLARLEQPLLSPSNDERDGYVPNVVYSCGALMHEDTIVMPYGCSDASIRFALIDLTGLLNALRKNEDPSLIAAFNG
jgi:predicted GH43/DUF377 family glycosyl hydrolase